MTLYELYLIRFAERFCVRHSKNSLDFKIMFKQIVFGMDQSLIAETCKNIVGY